MLKVFWAATCVAKWISILCSLGLNSQRGTECVIKALWFLNWLKLLPTFYSAGISTKHTALNQFQPRRESWKPRKHVVLFTGLFTVRIAEQTPHHFFMLSLQMPPRFGGSDTLFSSPLLKGSDFSLIYYNCETQGFILVEWFNALSNTQPKYHKTHGFGEELNKSLLTTIKYLTHQYLVTSHEDVQCRKFSLLFPHSVKHQTHNMSHKCFSLWWFISASAS